MTYSRPLYPNLQPKTYIKSDKSEEVQLKCYAAKTAIESCDNLLSKTKNENRSNFSIKNLIATNLEILVDIISNDKKLLKNEHICKTFKNYKKKYKKIKSDYESSLLAYRSL